MRRYDYDDEMCEGPTILTVLVVGVLIASAAWAIPRIWHFAKPWLHTITG